MSEPVRLSKPKSSSPVQRAPKTVEAPKNLPLGPEGAQGPTLAAGQAAAPALSLAPPVQTKLQVNQPGDSYEREADSVAQRVTDGEKVHPSQISPIGPGGLAQRANTEQPKPDSPGLVQRDSPPKEQQPRKERQIESEPVLQGGETVQKAEAAQQVISDKTPVQKADASKQMVSDKTPVQKAESQSPNAADRIQRAVIDEGEADARAQEAAMQAQTKAEPSSSKGEASESAAQAITSKGAGRPMNSGTQGALESSMGVGLGQVRVHDDDKAHQAASSLNARAFTHGSDIWLARGESDANRSLMAHEAAHVVQQSGGVQRMVQRLPPTTNGGGGAPASDPANEPVSAEQARRDLETLNLPGVKARHRTLYGSWASSSKLKRVKVYNRGEPNQAKKWLATLEIDPQKLQQIHFNPNQRTGAQTIEVPGVGEFTMTRGHLYKLLKIPRWDKTKHENSFDVDHMVELQAGNWKDSEEANEIQNMELLDSSSNRSSGALISNAIERNIRTYLTRTNDPSTVEEFLVKEGLPFRHVNAGRAGPGERGEGVSQFWTFDEIKSGLHLEGVKPVKNPGVVGSATKFALISPGGEAVLGQYQHRENEFTFPVTNKADQTRVGGLKITQFQLSQDYFDPAKQPDSQIGTLTAEWNLPKGIQPESSPSAIPVLKGTFGQYTGEIGRLPDLPVNLPGASPITFELPHFEGDVIVARGRLNPTVPMLGNVPIEVRFFDGDITFFYIYSPGEVSLPVPGIHIDDSTLALSFGTDGFSVGGMVALSVPNLGRGSLEAGLHSSRGFEARGTFQFDTELFDRADITLQYSNQAFSGSGTIAIDRAGKIRGISSAQIQAEFTEQTFSAQGNVQPEIPGVQEAGMTVSYSEQEGLTIGGTLQLSDRIPGISSGSIEAQVRKQPEENRWIVSASGTAVPAIPGVASTVAITYNDGMFDVNGSAAYERGMLSGSLQIGVTNRAVSAEGQPEGDPTDRLTAYGGGTAAIQIAPWLRGTIGVRLLPNGEIEVSGAIGLPDTLDIFPEKRFDRNIFSIGIDIPIIGVSAAGQRIGIFANITGGLTLGAGIGPGQLRGVNLGVTYNPDHEDQTKVTGTAGLYVPAEAGLRLFVRGGIGAGIPIVSAQAGLELGGALSLFGALQAGVNIDWTPTSGLQINAEGYLFAEPRFKFDISAFVLVELGLLFTTITLYNRRWQLAAMDYGSNLRLGVRFPVHYLEGQPFDLSLDQVQFEVPNVNAREVLTGLVEQIV
jgi:hypothetical protein